MFCQEQFIQLSTAQHMLLSGVDAATMTTNNAASTGGEAGSSHPSALRWNDLHTRIRISITRNSLVVLILTMFS